MSSITQRSDWGAGISSYLLYLVAIATLGSLQFGYHLAELNAPEHALRCITINSPNGDGEIQSGLLGLPECIRMNSTQFGLVSSIYTLGGLIGALAAGPLSSRYGRLVPLRLTVPFFVIGSLFGAAAPSVDVLSIGRFLSGIGAGASIVVGPIYISEISPSGSKGILGALTQVSINIGILLTQILGYFMNYGSMWRVVLVTGAGLGVLQFFGLAGTVESPEWLGANGKPVLARRTLLQIRSGSLSEEESAKWGTEGEEGDENEALLASQPTPSDTMPGRKDTKQQIGILEVISHPDNWAAIVAVIAVMVSQQLTGVNSVIMYSVNFLSELLPTTAGLITVAVGALNLVVTIACAPLADRFGRKICLLVSIAGMGANALLLAFGIIYGVKVLTGIVTLLFVASFAVGLGPVPFILASELVGPEAVGATQSWALAANWSATFLVAQFFPMLNQWMGKGKVFFLFAGLAVVFFAFISYWVPETKGKKDADEVWGRERRDD